ncbi:MAG: ABC transporter permease [Candidatus Nanoarchaeia archaeon]|nr:ABC transporter permease [Candidatus Nanoarchaeia archaeon]MDD5741464.1 ABC transporter permease [Candidatus Nanoarchaeia archaeon]
MIADYFKIAVKSLKQKKTRSMLTLLGIFLAIITIFVLMSLSLGLNDFVNEQFQMLGGNIFFIQPKGQAGAPGAGGAVELTVDDANIVEKVNGVNRIAYAVVGNAKIGFDNKNRYYLAMGIPLDNPDYIELFFDSMNLGIDEGRILRAGDKKKVVIGYNYKYKNLFDKPVKTGNKIKINDVEFEVIGVLDAIGNPGDDQNLYISYDDAKELFNSGNRVDMIDVEIKTGEDLKTVADRVERKLIKFRNVDEKTVDFTVQTPEELLSAFDTILNILTAFLVGIGSISVIVGGIGIANTMYTSVLERNKEIGTMKAIGARNSDILLIFVIEAGILGLIGGISGVIVGIIIAKSIEYVAAAYIGSNIIRASLNPILIVGSLLFALLIGIISGLTPSYQASKLKPVDTLRYE